MNFAGLTEEITKPIHSAFVLLAVCTAGDGYLVTCNAMHKKATYRPGQMNIEVGKCAAHVEPKHWPIVIEDISAHR